jgi:hypothetical protein
VLFGGGSDVSAKLTVVRTEKVVSDERIIELLEGLLAGAKKGEIDRLLVVGMDSKSGITYRLRHRAMDAALIGAAHCVLQQIEREWNESFVIAK